jgi:hypothetical protein
MKKSIPKICLQYVAPVIGGVALVGGTAAAIVENTTHETNLVTPDSIEIIGGVNELNCKTNERTVASTAFKLKMSPSNSSQSVV